MPAFTKSSTRHALIATGLAAAMLAGCSRESPEIGEPLPPPSKVADQQVVVTGSRIAGQAYAPAPVAPVPAQGDTMREQIAGLRYPHRVPPENRERYDGEEISPVNLVMEEPVSTFSVDVDTGSYANVRRFLTLGNRPPEDAVRTEELINYFRYDYPAPEDRSVPFTVSTDMAISPWNADTRLLRIGLRGYDLPAEDRPAANLVFLLDVSGSMNSDDKLPLVKTAMRELAGNLRSEDRVSIVVYAGAAGLVLPATSDTRKIRSALDKLEAGGSTAGGEGLKLAYETARENFIADGVNRVLIATDGDFNVGLSDRDALVEMIERERDSGITLTTLGFGTGNYNEAMMEQIADHGNGNYAYIDSALEAGKVLSDEMQSTLFTIAKDVKIQVEFNPARVSQYRLLGYENRALREEDFDNDRVDAGEIGAGHQVTAIYEVVPAGTDGWIADRRYAPVTGPDRPGRDDEVAFVKLRYKMPGGDRSTLMEHVVPYSAMARAARPQGDMAFATAVAAYGQLLRGDNLMGDFGFADAADLASREARVQNDFWRQQFIRLAGIAESLDES